MEEKTKEAQMLEEADVKMKKIDDPRTNDVFANFNVDNISVGDMIIITKMIGRPSYSINPISGMQQEEYNFSLVLEDYSSSTSSDQNRFDSVETAIRKFIYNHKPTDSGNIKITDLREYYTWHMTDKTGAKASLIITLPGEKFSKIIGKETSDFINRQVRNMYKLPQDVYLGYNHVKEANFTVFIMH